MSLWLVTPVEFIFQTCGFSGHTKPANMAVHGPLSLPPEIMLRKQWMECHNVVIVAKSSHVSRDSRNICVDRVELSTNKVNLKPRKPVSREGRYPPDMRGCWGVRTGLLG